MHLIRLTGKKPFEPSWPDLPSREILPGENTGLNLEKSNIVDIDLDTPKARAIAYRFLPKTATFGHGGTVSHYFYRGQYEHHVFRHPNKNTILEIRAGHGKQTMIPPSIHPDTHARLEWHTPLQYIADWSPDLEGRCRLLVAATLVSEIWGEPGDRHDRILNIVGFLIVHGRLPPNEVQEVILAAAELAGDDDVEDRLRMVQTTQDRLREDKSVSTQIADPHIARALVAILGGSDLPIVSYSKKYSSGTNVRNLSEGLAATGLVYTYKNELYVDERRYDMGLTPLSMFNIEPKFFQLVQFDSPLTTIQDRHLRSVLVNAANTKFPDIKSQSSSATLTSLDPPTLQTEAGYHAPGIWIDKSSTIEAFEQDPVPFLLEPFSEYQANDKEWFRTVVLHLILSGFVRSLIPTCPLTVIAANQSGVGKDLLLETISLMVSGTSVTRLPNTAITNTTPRDYDNAIITALTSPSPYAVFANCNRQAVGGNHIDKLITEPEFVGRQSFGKQETYQNNKVFCVNGNAMKFKSDFARRMIRLMLVAGVAEPWKRQGLPDITYQASQQHMTYLAAIMKLMHQVPAHQSDSPWYGFREWDAQVRQRLLKLGFHDLLNPPLPAIITNGDETHDELYMYLMTLVDGVMPCQDLLQVLLNDTSEMALILQDRIQLEPGKPTSHPARLRNFISSRIDTPMLNGLVMRRKTLTSNARAVYVEKYE